MSIRLFAPLSFLLASLALTSCGGGGGGNDPVPATLEVIKTGAGNGTVSGDAINCGTTCTANTVVGGTVTLTATPGAGQVFDGWGGDAAGCGTASGCNVAINGPRAIARASFSPAPTTAVSVTLGGNSMGTVTSNPAGINCPTDCTETYPRSGMVTLTATPANANNVFVNWTGDAAGCGTSRGCSLMLSSAAINATANFQPVGRSLAVSKTGSGTVTSSPAGINCGNDCGETYQQGTMVTLTSTAAPGFTFTGWGGACSGTGNCVLTMDADKSVTATFVSNNVTLSVSRIGAGTVTSAPAGINCGLDCSESYARNASVTLTATADASATFQGWSGGGCSGSGSTCTLTLTDNVTVTASFSGQAGQGELFGLTSSGRIVSFDRASPGSFRTNAAITGLGAGESVVAIDTRPADENIYALTGAGKLYTVNLISGAATLKSTLTADPNDGTSPYMSLSGTRFGIDFNPLVDRLRIVSDSGQNLRVNVDNGQVITDGALNRTGESPAAADAAYTFNFATPASTSLFVVDSGSDTLYLQNPPNDGTQTAIGPLGVDFASKAGFEIIGTNIDAFVAGVVVGGAAQGALYSIDLRSGAAAKVGDFSGTEPLISLAAKIAPAQAMIPGDLAVLTSTGKLLTVNRSSADTIRTNFFITGVPAAEQMLDLDYRTSDRTLYLLTRTAANVGKLYQVDQATASASLISTISGTNTALTGNVVKMDFVPTTATAASSETVHVLSDTGINLTVTVSNGVATTNAAPSPGTPVLGGLAYTNAFLQTNRTTAYVIDTNTRRLLTLLGGTLTPVGDLGLTTLASNIGFDVSGVNNEGLLVNTESGVSKLYRVDLVTGAASAPTALSGGEVAIAAALKPMGEPETYAVAASVRGAPCAAAQSPCFIRFNSAPNTYTRLNSAPFTLGAGVTLLGMDFRPSNGTLVALGASGTEAKLYTINLSNGVATVLSTLVADTADTTAPFAVSMLPTGNNKYSVDFNPSADRLRVAGGSGNVNLRINVDTGETITDTAVARPPLAITGIAFNNTANSPTLFGIDSRSDRLYQIDSSQIDDGLLTTVGNLNIDVSDANGFEIIPSSGNTNVARFVSADAVDGLLKLYLVDLATGAASLIAPITGSNVAITGFRGLSAAANSDLFGITTNNLLTSFNRDTGVVITNPQAIAGIGPGETIIGMDFSNMTSDTRLYVVSRVDATGVGKVYTLNTTTRVATPVATGSMTQGGMGFVLVGNHFGIDINQADSTLRVVSDSKVNINVSLSTLAVTPRENLFETIPSITAGAYTNNYANYPGTVAPVLLHVDTENNNLMRQAPPNDGTLFDLRFLGIVVNDSNGASGEMDIVGGDNGYGIAAFRGNGDSNTGADAYSTLYRVNLDSAGAGNALTSIGTVGTIPTPVTGSAVRVEAMATRLTP